MTSSVSIKDIAQACGCSIATVSRALSGGPDGKHREVSEATRLLIRQRAAEMNYAPSAAARTLVRGHSDLLGVVLDTGPGRPDLDHPFFQRELAALRAGAEDRGLDLLIFSTRRLAGARFSTLRNQAQRHRVEAVVVMTIDFGQLGAESIDLGGIPCVAIDIDVRGDLCVNVASDNVAGAALAVRHLHDVGHSRIATIAGPSAAKPSRERLCGYREELERLGIPFRSEYVQRGDFFYDSAGPAMAALFALPEPPTAVFIATDIMAAGAVRWALDGGMSVPGDVAIVGFDGLKLTEQISPQISTVQQDPYALGLTAMRALDELRANPGTPPVDITLPVSLVVRESSAGSRRRTDSENQ